MNPAEDAEMNLLQELSSRNLNIMQPSQIYELSLAIAASSVYEEQYENSKWTRDSMLDTLLSFQNEDGGFPSSVNSQSTVYSTQYALLALSFYPDIERASTAAENAINFLASQDLKPQNCEETAVLIYSLASNGISSDDDRFSIGSSTLYDYMMNFEYKNGGFIQSAGDAAPSVSATQHAMLAEFAAENLHNPLDITGIDYAYQPPSTKDNIISIVKKLLIVLVIIYISLLLVNRMGKKRAYKEQNTSISKPEN